MTPFRFTRWLASLGCRHTETFVKDGELHCFRCGKVQMVMLAPSGRMLVMWVSP